MLRKPHSIRSAMFGVAAVGLLLFAFPPVAGAEPFEPRPIPQDVLAEVLKKQQQIAFWGERIQTIFSGDPDREDIVLRQRIFHTPPSDYRIDRLDLPEDKEWHLLAKGEFIYIWGASKKVSVRERSPDQTLGLVLTDTYIELLRKNYLIRASEGPQIADRSTIEIRIDPHYPGRPSIRAWVDSTYGVPLRLEEYGPEGNLYSRYEYRRIRFRPQLRVDELSLPEGVELLPESRAIECSTPGEFLRKTEKHAPLADHLPAGFTLTKVRLGKFGRRRDKEYVQSFFSDGLASFSIFAAPDPEDVPNGKEKPGLRCVSSGQRLEHAFATGWIGVTRIFITGDIAESELLEVLSSVRLESHAP